MSVDSYRREVDRLLSEVTALEGKAASEREKAARERAAGLRASQSVTPRTSLSIIQSKQREAQRREEQAVRHDKEASRLGTEAARKRKSATDAQRRLERAETDTNRRNSSRQAQPAFAPGPSPEDDQGVAFIEVGEDEAPARTTHGAADSADGNARVAITRLVDETIADAALEAGKATALGALSSVPVIGPVLRELVGISWGDTRAERVTRFAVALGRDVEALQDRIDREFVSRDEFADLAEDAMERMVQRRNAKKIERFAAAVAHSATVDRPESRHRERFLDLLHDLRPIHLAVLSRLAAPPAPWVRPGDVITTGQVVSSRLAQALDGLAVDQYEMAELQTRGLVGSLDDTVTLLAAADNLSALITPMGHQFIAFVTAPVTAHVEGATLRIARSTQGGSGISTEPSTVHGRVES